MHRVALVGGDTTRGPLSICITAHGFVAPGRVLRRDGARVGDEVWVSGALGDAAASLALRGIGDVHAPSRLAEDIADALARRLDRPTPRLALGRALVGIATSCIDVSDGLLADARHVARASGVGLRLEVDALPASDALRIAFDGEDCRRLQAAGGDDYELCFTASPEDAPRVAALSATCGVGLTRIGTVVAGGGIDVVDRDGHGWIAPRAGFDHFAAGSMQQ